MNTLEQRLRTELPELTKALQAASIAQTPPNTPTSPEANESAPEDGRWIQRAVAAAFVLIVAAGVGLAIQARSEQQVATAPIIEGESRLGSWTRTAAAPIQPRSAALSVWTGSDALFWAGWSGEDDALFAYSSGARYDPDTNRWDSVPTPETTHPGFAGDYLNNALFAVAKARAIKLDLPSGNFVELPPLDEVNPTSFVTVDDTWWLLGETGNALSAVPLSATADRWLPGFTTEPDMTTSESWTYQSLSSPVLADDKFVIWSRTDTSLIFDTVDESWQTLPPLVAPNSANLTGTSEAVSTTDGFVVVTELRSGDTTSIAVATLVDGEWQWLETSLSFPDFASATIAAAGDSVLLIPTSGAPAIIHLQSNTWLSDTEAPLLGVEEPNTVWTGRELIIWGGARDGVQVNEGYVWTPAQ